jgi:hypothetical protein
MHHMMPPHYRMNAEKFAKEAELQKYMALAEADPFNPEVQKKIEELINQKNIEDNYDQAMEFSPEVCEEGSLDWIQRTYSALTCSSTHAHSCHSHAFIVIACQWMTNGGPPTALPLT